MTSEVARSPRWVAPVLAVLSVAWTWPALPIALGLHGEALLARGFDGWGVAWTLAHAQELLVGLHDASTGFPEGADYHRIDSWVALASGIVLAPLGGPRALAAFVLVGVWVSALAAEMSARALGARAPWSLLAAGAWAFGGLGATAMLEGHAYLAINPFLPMVAAGAIRLRDDAATRVFGLRAWLVLGVGLAGTLLTTAYAAVAGALVAAVLGVAGLLAHRGDRPAQARLVHGNLAALAVVTPVAALYAWAFVSADTFDGRLATTTEQALTRAQAMSLTLLDLLGPTPEVDRGAMGQAPGIGAVVLAGMVAAPIVLKARPGWRGLYAAALVGIVLALGPTLLLADDAGALPLPYRALMAIPGAGFLRFPYRFAWVWALCGGLVAARVATVLAEQVGPRRVALLLLLGLGDAFLVARLPLRARTQVAGTPSAYLEGAGPVLDLYPAVSAVDEGLSGWMRGWACSDALGHGRAIADHCQAVRDAENPRARRDAILMDTLLSGRVEDARKDLQREGFTAVAWHPDLFPPGEASRLRDALAKLDPSPARSTDAGALVVVYAVTR